MADTDALILGLEIDAVRPVIAEQIQAAGGATQWLQQRAASGPLLSASEALAWLDLAGGGTQPVAAQSLRMLADATSVAPWKGSSAPSVTILYSGGTAGGTAAAIGEHDVDTVRIIDHSHVGELLASEAFNDAARDVAAASTDGSAPQIKDFLDDLLYEPATLAEDGTRSGAGLWDEASARFAPSVSGDVITLTSAAEDHRTFAVTELEALLDNPDVTTINGMSRSLLEAPQV